MDAERLNWVWLVPACTLEAVNEDLSSTLQRLSYPGTAGREVLLDPNEGTVVDREGEHLDPPPLQLLQFRPHTIRFRLKAGCIQKVGHTLKQEDGIISNYMQGGVSQFAITQNLQDLSLRWI